MIQARLKFNFSRLDYITKFMDGELLKHSILKLTSKHILNSDILTNNSIFF